MNYAAIKWADVANGPGVRVSLFVSGCTHRCPGCFNEEAQDFGYGQPFTQAEEDKIVEALAPAHIKGPASLPAAGKRNVSAEGNLVLFWVYSG